MGCELEVINCKSCRRLFNYLGGPQLCPQCLKIEDEKFSEVKQFISDNPTANINEVAEKMEVSVNQLKKWVREERLEFSKTSSVTLECEKCGAPVRTGRFCSNCKNKMVMEMGNSMKQIKESAKKDDKFASPKMRYLDK